MLGELVSGFLSTLKVYQYASSTAEAYQMSLRDLVEYLERLGKPPEDVDYSDAEGWLISLEKRKYTGATLRRHLAAARGFWRELQRRKVVQYNPFKDIRQIRYESPLPEPLSEVQIRAIIDGERDPMRHALWECFYATGFRISSVRAIERGHVDFDAHTIRAKRKRGQFQVQHMTAALELAIREHYKYSPDGVLLFSSRMRGREGKPLTTKTIRQYLREAATRAGITRDIWPHLLRHSIATHLLDNGADVREIQEFLDHKSIQTTQIYTRVSKARLRKVIEECHPRP